VDDLKELAKSLLTASSAATLFGVSQAGRLLDPRAVRRDGEVPRHFDSVADAAGRQLDGPLRSLFTRVDAVQRGMVDLVADAVTLNPSGLVASSGPLLQPALSALNPVVSAVDRLLPDRAVELRWQELNNKIEIYFLVQNAESRLGMGPRDETPLPELVERAYALGPFLSLWAVEGLGHVYAARAMKVDPSPAGLLTGVDGGAVRPGSLLMLHAGLGLAFAQSLLESATTRDPRSGVRAAVQEFVRLCRENCRPGYIGAAYESLGLVTRTFHGQLLEVIDREVQSLGDGLLGYYWHGVGRAIYFAPRNFLPCSRIDWAGVGDAVPHEAGRVNLISGLAWATTLVNMRQPAIMAHLIQQNRELLAHSEAFSNGVASSIVMREDTTPDASLLRDFCAFRSETDQRLWDRLIGRPCRDSVSRLYPQLREAGHLDSVFQFQRTAGPFP